MIDLIVLACSTL